MALSSPSATYSDDLYHYLWADIGVECLVENFNDRKEDIACELTVNLDHPLMGGRLYSGRLLLLGPNSRRDVKNALMDRYDGVEWDGVLEQLCMLTRDRLRRGEPPVDLSTIDYSDRPRYLLEPFIVANGISILYGDGATSKSTFALWWAVQLALRGIKTLYLDWEDDAETHAERLSAIRYGLDAGMLEGLIFYQRRSVRLSESVREVRRFCAENQIGHIVVDSVGMAAGDPNNHDFMIEAVRAAQSLRLAATLIHHLPKDAKDKTKPFGSVYASNEARNTWLIEKAQEEEADELAVLLTNQKYNRGKYAAKRAYKVIFTNEGDELISVAFAPTDIGQVEAFKSKLPQWRQIRDVLLRHPNSTPLAISEVLELDNIKITPNQVGTVMRRRKDIFINTGVGLWAVLTQEEVTQTV